MPTFSSATFKSLLLAILGYFRTSYLEAPLPLVWTMTIMAIRNNTLNRTGMICLVLMERKRREKWRVPKANELPTRFVEQITLRAAVHSVRKERFDKNRNQTADMILMPDINRRMAMSGA